MKIDNKNNYTVQLNNCQLILAGNNVNEPTDVTLVEASTVAAMR